MPISTSAGSLSTREKQVQSELRPISRETLRKDQGRLRDGGEAWRYLQNAGLCPETLKETFGVGFASLMRSQGSVARGRWLTAPVMNSNGVLLKRIVKLAVPEVSVNPADSKVWCAGSALTYWCGSRKSQRWLFVASDVLDAWRIWFAVRGTSLEGRMAIIASTDGKAMPDYWKNLEFWEGWERVYLGHDNTKAGEDVASEIRTWGARDFLRVEVPRNLGRSWIEYFDRDGGRASIDSFETLLDRAQVLSAKAPSLIAAVPLSEQEDGVYEDRRININGAFENGQMYYPFQVRRVENIRRKKQHKDGSIETYMQKSSYYETRVVRSDGAMLEISVAPAPRGVEEEDRAIVLQDGTEIISIPKPREFSTWTWPSIKKFSEDVRARTSPHRPLWNILKEVRDHLRQVTWLPNETDYDLLAAYVAMSYCYNAFDAIPMLLLNGEKGSGKSSLAEALSDLSFNGKMLGGGSEKAFVRFVDQGRGLLVLDDLEAVGRRGPNDGGYGDTNQILKVSYSKATGLKSVVEKNGTTKLLNFYGPKVVTNISGIDAVNATRMYTILCRPMPSGVADSGRIRGRNTDISEPLRQELHAWGMANVLDAHRIYLQKSGSRRGRAEQIAAPILVIAEMTGEIPFIENVEKALTRLAYGGGGDTGAEDLVVRAVESVIERGARKLISLAQIRAELALMPEARLLEPANQVPSDIAPLQDHNALGRMLRTLGIRTLSEGPRVRLSGQLMRCYEIEPGFVSEALSKAEKEDRAVDVPYIAQDHKRLGVAFCDNQLCQGCPYSAICEAALPGVRKGKAQEGANRPRSRRRR